MYKLKFWSNWNVGDKFNKKKKKCFGLNDRVSRGEVNFETLVAGEKYKGRWLSAIDF